MGEVVVGGIGQRLHAAKQCAQFGHGHVLADRLRQLCWLQQAGRWLLVVEQIAVGEADAEQAVGVEFEVHAVQAAAELGL